MAVIDVQVHAYERNHPGRPWVGHLHGPQSANGEEMTAAMDAVGVDGAIIVSTFNLYRYDPGYALEVYAKYPERFRVVKPIDPANPAVDEVVAEWAKTKGAVGVRLMLRDEQIADPTDPRLNRAFAAAGRHGPPVNFLCWGHLDDGAELVRRNPDTVIVIDHLGLLQPNEPPPLAEPWADLPKLLALAAHPNVRVKIRPSSNSDRALGALGDGACRLLHRAARHGVEKQAQRFRGRHHDVRRLPRHFLALGRRRIAGADPGADIRRGEATLAHVRLLSAERGKHLRVLAAFPAAAVADLSLVKLKVLVFPRRLAPTSICAAREA